MKLQSLASGLLFASSTFGAVIKRAEFKNGQPIDGKGKGAPILGMHAFKTQRLQRQKFNVFGLLGSSFV